MTTHDDEDSTDYELLLEDVARNPKLPEAHSAIADKLESRMWPPEFHEDAVKAWVKLLSAPQCDPAIFERFEEFVKHQQMDWARSDVIWYYQAHPLVRPLFEYGSGDDFAWPEYQETQSRIAVSLAEAQSATRIEVWWKVLRDDSQRRLDRPILEALRDNPNTPPHVSDAVCVDLLASNSD